MGILSFLLSWSFVMSLDFCVSSGRLISISRHGPSRFFCMLAHQNNFVVVQMSFLNDPGFPDSSGSYFLITSGGLDVNQNVVNTVDIYNTTNRTWAPASGMKSPRARHTLTPIGSGTRSAVAIGGIQVIYCFYPAKILLFELHTSLVHDVSGVRTFTCSLVSMHVA